MSWEAFRLTSKSPSELLQVMGPGGVDSLVREMLQTVWRELPPEDKSLDRWRKRVQEVFDRNMRVWRAIKKPSPEAFFQNLAPFAADGHFRQALVLSWMMMPRTGGRTFADTIKIVTHIYNRIIAAWDEDVETFTGTKAKRTVRAKPVSKKAKRVTTAKPRAPKNKTAKRK